LRQRSVSGGVDGGSEWNNAVSTSTVSLTAAGNS